MSDYRSTEASTLMLKSLRKDFMPHGLFLVRTYCIPSAFNKFSPVGAVSKENVEHVVKSAINSTYSWRARNKIFFEIASLLKTMQLM